MAIEAENITKRYGDFTALEDVTLSIPAGSLTALLGPSGSGKSTLLRVIAGLEEPDAGVVRIDGGDVTRVRPQHRGVGFVFQHYAAFSHMSVRQNIAFGMTVRKRPKGEIAERVDEMLSLVQLEGFGDRYPDQISGGQRQRMALARALCVDPGVLLLDEPFGALDARVRADLRRWLRRLHEKSHVTTVLVTHDQEEAMDVADRIAVMDHARLQQVGSPEELYEDPSNPFVMEFMGSVNRIGDTYVRPHDIALSTGDGGEGATPAQVVRVVHLGFEVRLELQAVDGRFVTAQITRDEARELGLHEGDFVQMSPRRARSFPPVAPAA